jgi:hypothetical protein
MNSRPATIVNPAGNTVTARVAATPVSLNGTALAGGKKRFFQYVIINSAVS